MSTTPTDPSPFSARGPQPGAHVSAGAAERSWWLRAEVKLEQWGELLNPILVKEARQALKSNQFLITFILLLACGWAWSFLGVTMRMPDIRYVPSGPYMLAGYFIVLVIPLFVVVPFAAFRSLAAEREDGTFELMTITTLNARQIVTGKLGSAILQMLVYYSALSPCIAFTYLLRGIDVVLIGVVLYYTLVISILLATFGLLVATLTSQRHWQVLLSILLIMGLLLVSWAWMLFVLEELLNFNAVMPADEPIFWMVQLCLTTVALSFAVLFVQAAASRITFASDNRATRLRAIIFAQHALLVGWCCYFLASSSEFEILYFMVAAAGVYGMAVGAMMVGESPVLSPRVLRSLPQTFLGRMCFTWFNPGSGTGYLFVVTNLLAIVFVALVIGAFASLLGSMGTVAYGWSWFWCGWVTWCYVTAYLGAVRLLMLFARRFGVTSIALSFLTTVLLLVGGAFVPLLLEGLVTGFENVRYSTLQVTNWAWTFVHIAERGVALNPQIPVLTMIVALFFLLVNVVQMADEVAQVRSER